MEYICPFCNLSVEADMHICSLCKHNNLINKCHLCCGSENTMIASSTGSLRDNKGKLPIHWVPLCVIEAIAAVLWKNSKPGGGKYPEHNWQKGNKHSVPLDSLLRHAHKLADGEKIDPDDQLRHSWKILCNAAFLVFYEKFYPEMDDMPKRVEEKK